MGSSHNDKAMQAEWSMCDEDTADAIVGLHKLLAATQNTLELERESARKAAHDWQETVRDQARRLAKAERERDANFAAYEQEKRERLAERAELWKEQEALRQRVAVLEEALDRIERRIAILPGGGIQEAFGVVREERAALAQKDEPTPSAAPSAEPEP